MPVLRHLPTTLRHTMMRRQSLQLQIGTAHCRMSYQNAFFEYIRYDVRDRERERVAMNW